MLVTKGFDPKNENRVVVVSGTITADKPIEDSYLKPGAFLALKRTKKAQQKGSRATTKIKTPVEVRFAGFDGSNILKELLKSRKFQPINLAEQIKETFSGNLVGNQLKVASQRP